MSSCSKKLGVFFAAFVVFALVFVAILGMTRAIGMEMRGDGTMSGCLFDGRTEICPMNLAEHLSRWQAMFTVIPQKTDFLILFLILVSISALFALASKQNLLLLWLSRLSDRWRLYAKQNPHLPLFNYLQEAFSQGILNPKIYELAAL